MLSSILFHATLLLVISRSLGNDSPTVTVALMLENENSSIFDITHFQPAFDIAIEELHQLYEEHSYAFYVNFTIRETGSHCGEKGLAAPAIAAQMLQNSSLNIHAFFGPLCYTETAAVADLAAYWNIPIFSALDTNPVLLNKERFKTLVRMSHSRGEVAEFVQHIFEHFSWKHSCVLLWDNQNQEYADLAESIKETMTRSNISFDRVVLSDYADNIQKALLQCTESARGRCESYTRWRI